MSAPKEIPIPGPRGVPILGNIYDIEPEVPLNSIDLLADNYGESMILLALIKSYHLLTTAQARSFVSPPLAVPVSSSAHMSLLTRSAMKSDSVKLSLKA